MGHESQLETCTPVQPVISQGPQGRNGERELLNLPGLVTCLPEGNFQEKETTVSCYSQHGIWGAVYRMVKGVSREDN